MSPRTGMSPLAHHRPGSAVDLPLHADVDHDPDRPRQTERRHLTGAKMAAMGRYDQQIADLEARVQRPCPCCGGTGHADGGDEPIQDRVRRALAVDPGIAQVAQELEQRLIALDVVDDHYTAAAPGPPRPNGTF